jgi:hypothetical protein
VDGRATPFGKEGVMTLGRALSLNSILLAALLLASCSSNSPTHPESNGLIEVDLSTFPDTGDPVPDETVLGDQWASIGILFDAEPDSVDLINRYFGGTEGSIFFSPDIENVTAVFRFVEPGTMDPVDITAFELYPWFDPGESAELVGLDEGGAEVVIDAVVPEDIGSESKSLRMAIEGTFRVVEWRTHGNPGIAAGGLAFEF